MRSVSGVSDGRRELSRRAQCACCCAALSSFADFCSEGTMTSVACRRGRLNAQE